MIILSKIRAALVAIYRWVGDAANRRFLAGALVFLAYQLYDKELDLDGLDMLLTVILGGATSAWSSRTNGLKPIEKAD